MRTSDLKDAIKLSMDTKLPMLLWGEPGIGKSQLVQQVAKEMGYNLIDLRMSQLDPVDLRGLPSVDSENNQTKWIPPNFLPPSNSKDKWVLFLDEMLQAPPLVQAASFQLILDRKVGDYTLPENAIVIGATNNETDRSGVGKILKALANRFIHLFIDPDFDYWKVWAYKNNIDPSIISYLEFEREAFHKFDPSSKSNAFPTPRTWEYVDKIIKANSPSNVEFSMISGAVGEGVAGHYYSFLKICRELPDVDKVLTAPDSVPVPTGANSMSIKYAMVGTLLHRVTSRNAKNILKYLSRLEKEFEVLFIKDLLTKCNSGALDPKVQECKAVGGWVLSNHEIIKNA